MPTWQLKDNVCLKGDQENKNTFLQINYAIGWDFFLSLFLNYKTKDFFKKTFIKKIYHIEVGPLRKFPLMEVSVMAALRWEERSLGFI